MAKKNRKSSTGPDGDSCAHATKAVTTSVNKKSPARAAIPQPPAARGHAAAFADTVTKQLPLLLPRPKPTKHDVSNLSTPRPDSWDPWKRYWSSSNSLPEYKHDSQTTMSSFSFKNVGRNIGGFLYGNMLNNRNPQPPTPSPATPTKRPGSNESDLANPSKRIRTDDEDHNVYIIPSSPGTSESSQRARNSFNRRDSRGSTSQRPTSSVVKRGARDSPSLLSNGERQSKHVEVEEYRRTAQHANAKSRGGRSRHSKKSVNGDKGQAPQAQQSSNGQRPSQRPPSRQNRGLMQNKEIRGDGIVDDDDDELRVVDKPQVPKPRMANGHGYTNSHFRLPVASTSGSDSEEPRDVDQDEIAILPTPIRPEPAARKPEEQRRLESAKRRAPSPEDTWLAQKPKRRQLSMDRYDISRTEFVSKRTLGGRSDKLDDHVMKIESAVCEPRSIYPWQDGMRKDARGASDISCVLSQTGSDNRNFRIMDDSAMDLPELEWITPELTKIFRIHSCAESPIVWLKKSTDLRSKNARGVNLIIKFRSNEDARRYVEHCEKANRNIQYQNLSVDKMERIFSMKLSNIRTENMKQPVLPPQDLELYERSARLVHPNSRLLVEADHTSEKVGRKSVRAQMKGGDDDAGLDTPISRSKSQQRPPITPAEEKEMRTLFPEDDPQDDEVKGAFSLRASRDRALPQNSHSATSRPQRNLRSSQPAVRSPSPPLERWTQQNPGWVANRNWKLPLIYERTTVNCGDIECLDEGQFLNDAIISFYAKYLHKQLEDKDENLAKKVYIFNSFFWETLRAKGYDGVKSWTAKVDLLSYDYIVVPINQHAHWYLTIICNPGALIPRDEPGDEAQEVKNEPDDEVQEVRIPPNDDGQKVKNEQNGDDRALSDNVAEDEKVVVVTWDLSQVSIEDHPTNSMVAESVDVTEKPSKKKSKSSKRRAPIRKYDPRAPRVITLDSLDGTHPAVVTRLKAYLIEEIRARKDLEVEAPLPFGHTAKDIPMQNNFTDCGVYLLGYIEEFMKDPYRFAGRILQQEERDWDVDAPALRNKIRDLIFELQQIRQKEEFQRRQKKRSLGVNKTAKDQDPATPTESSAKTTGDSEQTDQKAPRSRSRSPAIDRQTIARSTGSPAHRVNGNGERANSKTSSSKSPTPRAQPSSPVRPPPNQDCKVSGVFVKDIGHPKNGAKSVKDAREPSRSNVVHLDRDIEADNETPDVAASMIVNPNDSVDFDNERSKTATDRTPRHTKSAQIPADTACATPRRTEAIESRRDSKPRPTPESRQTSEPRQASQDRSPGGGYNQARFVAPLRSSTSASPAPTSRSSVERKGISPATTSGNHATPKQNSDRSRYFLSSSTVKSSSSGANHSERRNGTGTHKYHPVQSSPSSEQEILRPKAKGQKGKSSQKPTIDLTGSSREHIDLTDD